MLILAWGVLPPLALLTYIWWMDRAEREPIRVVARALGFGALSIFWAVILETIGGLVLDLLPLPSVAYSFLYYFCIVAVAEETGKRFAMKLAVWNDPEFNYVFDAIVYCVAAALGFAMVENIEYMMMDGAGIALARLIPVHSICAVFMGSALGIAKMYELKGDKVKARRAHIDSLTVPILIHGTYDFCVSSDSDTLAYLALAGVLALTIIAWFRIRSKARTDRPVATARVLGNGPIARRSSGRRFSEEEAPVARSTAPVATSIRCKSCGWTPRGRTQAPKFCPRCGEPFE